MKIAVLGTGVVGRSIAGKLLELGHEVYMGTRDPEQTQNMEKDDFRMSDWLGDHEVYLVTFSEAATAAEMLVNCSGGMVSLEVLRMANADDQGNKILLDVANPLDFSKGFPPTLNPCNDDSLGEQIQRNYPNLRVVKSLNTMNCDLMVQPSLVPGNHQVFMSGDDAEAKATVSSLLQSFGWGENRIIDLGGIETAKGAEQLLPIWLRLMQAKGSVMFNFAIIE
ncbi:MAG: NADP oxidoreductase [Bacteroidetes bacterium]|nr:NADP oxidoreductase [Bacteroidota bacterium]